MPKQYSASVLAMTCKGRSSEALESVSSVQLGPNVIANPLSDSRLLPEAPPAVVSHYGFHSDFPGYSEESITCL